MQSDMSYFSHRAEEELRAATTSLDPKARRVHLDLASRYDDLAQGILAHERRLDGAASDQRQANKPHSKRVGVWL